MDPNEIEKIITQAVTAALGASEARYREIIKPVADMVQRHDGLLYGNGHEGLKDKVTRLDRSVGGVSRVWGKVIETVVIAVVLGVIVLLVRSNLLVP